MVVYLDLKFAGNAIYLAAAATAIAAAIIVVIVAVVAAAAEQEDQQNNDPQAAAPAKAVIPTTHVTSPHFKVTRPPCGLGAELSPYYGADLSPVPNLPFLKS